MVSSDKGQNQLIWDFVQRGIAIPSLPLMTVVVAAFGDIDAAVYLVTLNEGARGAAPNSRRARPTLDSLRTFWSHVRDAVI